MKAVTKQRLWEQLDKRMLTDRESEKPTVATGGEHPGRTICAPASLRLHTAEPVEGSRWRIQTGPRSNAPIGLGFSHSLQQAATVAPLLALDLVLTAGSLLAANTLVAFAFESIYPTIAHQLLALVAVTPVVFASFGLYSVCGVSPIREMRQLVGATCVSFFFLLIANVTLGKLIPYETTLLATGCALALGVVTPLRLTARTLLVRCPWWGQPAVIIGAGERAQSVYRALQKNPALGLRPVGIIDDRTDLDCHHLYPGPRESEAPHSTRAGEAPAEPTILASGSSLDGSLASIRQRASWAIIANTDRPADELQRIVDLCAQNVPNLIVMPNVAGLPTLWTSAQDYGGHLGIHVQDRLLLPASRLLKRTMDILLVLIGLLILLPLLPVVYILIRTTSAGPVFYSQERIGRNGKRFRAWKFRTMVQNAERVLDEYLAAHPELRAEWNAFQKLKRDPRVIPGVGAILRIFSLDELPQIWNVLIGDMSLVGPRPMTADQIGLYGDTYPLYCKMRPGVTGLWQISGRNHTTFAERARFDTYYIRNWSPWFDLYILFRTIKTVLHREGAY